MHLHIICTLAVESTHNETTILHRQFHCNFNATDGLLFGFPISNNVEDMGRFACYGAARFHCNFSRHGRVGVRSGFNVPDALTRWKT